MSKRKTIFYFIPIFIALYVIISLLPKFDFTQEESEYFPFFNFDLYSLVPNEVTHYDLLFNKDEKDQYYFYYKNKSLDKIQAKFRRKWLREQGIEFEINGKINTYRVNSLIEDVKSVHLVRFKGPYSSFYKANSDNIKILYRLK